MRKMVSSLSILLFIFMLPFEVLSYGEGFDFSEDVVRRPKPTKLTDPNLIFNANMLTSGSVSSPNIIFANGVNAPIMNAWSMPTSTMSQRPVNMQFSIPSDLKTEKPISVELHFLIRRQSMANGNARIQVNSLYVHNIATFPAPSSLNYTHTNNSDDFAIIEPSQSDEFTHIFIDVPLDKSEIDRSDFALISFTRIAPEDEEYMGDIYLVAAVFRYTQK